jgi:tRNA-dihydrouridine synthase B
MRSEKPEEDGSQAMASPFLKIGGKTIEGFLVLAPMTGISDFPFRVLCRRLGAAATFTEMVSAEGIVRRSPRSLELLWSDGSDRPLWVQIFGSSPGVMAEAARICQEEGADMVDINMGCPVPKVVKTGGGAALMRDLKLAAKVVREVRRRITVPLTVKMRSGWDSTDSCFLELGRIAQEEGADALILHARSRNEPYSVRAKWHLIRALVEVCSVPVIGNGDVGSIWDAQRMMELTGAKGAMIGRAAVGNPWVFSKVKGDKRGLSHGNPLCCEEFWEVVDLHLKMIQIRYSEGKGLSVAKFHLSKYLKGFTGASQMRRQVQEAKNWRELVDLLKDFRGSEFP